MPSDPIRYKHNSELRHLAASAPAVATRRPLSASHHHSPPRAGKPMPKHINTILNRLTCWRTGHDPLYVVHSSSTLTLQTYRTACARCGTTYELAPQPYGTTATGVF